MEKTRKVAGFKVSESAYWKLIRENKGKEFVQSMYELNPEIKKGFATNERIIRNLEIAASQPTVKEKRVTRELRQMFLGPDTEDFVEMDKNALRAKSGILDEIVTRDLGAKVVELKKLMNIADFTGFVWNPTEKRYENESFWIEIHSTKIGDYGEDMIDWGEIA